MRRGGRIVQHHKAVGAVGNADCDTQPDVIGALVHFGHFSLKLHVGFRGVDVASAQVGDA